MTKNNKILVILLAAAALFAFAVYSGYQSKQTEQAPIPAQQASQTAGDESNTETTASSDETQGTGGVTFQNEETEDGFGLRAIGNPEAPVRMVEYSSLTCSHCASFHMNTLPDLVKRYVEKGDLYIQFEEFPLNAPALDASLLARCLPAERYYGFVDMLFKTQENWAARPDYRTVLIQNAKLAGLSEDKANECLESKEMRDALAGRIQAVNETHKITSTPTFIINGGEEVISGAQPLYEFERVFRTVSGNKVAPITE